MILVSYSKIGSARPAEDILVPVPITIGLWGKIMRGKLLAGPLASEAEFFRAGHAGLLSLPARTVSRR
jgi:hypothetical protein